MAITASFLRTAPTNANTLPMKQIHPTGTSQETLGKRMHCSSDISLRVAPNDSFGADQVGKSHQNRLTIILALEALPGRDDQIAHIIWTSLHRPCGLLLVRQYIHPSEQDYHSVKYQHGATFVVNQCESLGLALSYKKPHSSIRAAPVIKPIVPSPVSRLNPPSFT